MGHSEQAYDKTLQRMRELVPTCDPEGVYSVKRTCAELGVTVTRRLENIGPVA